MKMWSTILIEILLLHGVSLQPPIGEIDSVGTTESNTELNSAQTNCNWINTTPAITFSYMATTDTPATFNSVAVSYTKALHSSEVKQSITTKLTHILSQSPAEMGERKPDSDIQTPASVSITSLNASTSTQTLNASKLDVNLVTILQDAPLCNITGLAKFKDHIYLLCGWHHEHMHDVIKTIRVYEDGNHFDLLWLLMIEEIENPCDIIQDENSNCLYVDDGKENCIWKISLDDQKVVRWLCTTRRRLLHQPMVMDGRLLLLNWDETCNRLEIYGTDAVLIESIPLPCDIQLPMSVIQKSSELFIIAHHLLDGNESLCVISHLTRTGRVIRQFNPKNESKDLLWPCLLSLDPDNRRLFVLDYYNRNIILFDSDSLSWIQIILTKESDYLPWGYMYDRKKQQLIISECKTLYVYEIINRK